MTTHKYSHSTRDQRQRLQALVCRIAARTVSEWDKPLRRTPLARALPHLAIANPRLSYGDRGSHTPVSPHNSDKVLPSEGYLRLLDQELDIEILLRMDGEARTDRVIRTLQKGLQNAVTRERWYEVADILRALPEAGMDMPVALSLGLQAFQALQNAVETDGEGRSFIANLLNTLSDLGMEPFELLPLGLQALQGFLEGRGWYIISSILRALAKTGANLPELLFLGSQALQRSTKDGTWPAVASILEALAEAGANPPALLPLGLQALQGANEAREWSSAVRILKALADLGMDSSALLPLGLQTLQGATEAGVEFAVADTLKALADLGMDSSALLPLGFQAPQLSTKDGTWPAASILEPLSDLGMERVWMDDAVEGSRGQKLGQISTDLGNTWASISDVPELVTKGKQLQALLKDLSDGEIAALRG